MKIVSFYEVAPDAPQGESPSGVLRFSNSSAAGS